MTDMQFRRPSATDGPQRHLFFSNCGMATKIDVKAMESLLRSLSTIDQIWWIDDKFHMYVSFPSVEDAVRVREQLHNVFIPELGRKPLIEFAAEYQEPVPPPAPQCVSRSAHISIPGLVLIEDFISKEEEQELLQYIDGSPWDTLISRRVQHYGYEFNYKTRNIDPSKPLPSLPGPFSPVLNRLVNDQLIPFQPDQITVNEYQPGQGIASHVDTHSAFEDGLVSLSLAGHTVMEFAHPDGRYKQILLYPRSALIMTQESRYAWRHAVVYRKTDMINGQIVPRSRRVSLTIRKIRGYPCSCAFPELCDSQSGHVESINEETDTCYEIRNHESRLFDPSSELVADSGVDSEDQIVITEDERKHVHEVYDVIAPHFSHTRYKPWPMIDSFLKALPCGALVADVGCGNGKYLGVNPSLFMLGSDRSSNLIQICADRGFEVAVADNIKLNYRSNAFDAVISIAVVHHFSTEQNRLHAIRELSRITRPGGRILIYVWALEQEKKKFDKQDVLVPWHLQMVYETKDKNESDKAEEKTAKLPKRKRNKQKNPSTNQDNDVEPASELSNDELIREPVASTQPSESETVTPKLDHGIVMSEKNAVVYQRYYHMFVQGELDSLVQRIPALRIVDSYFDHANWCVVAEKIDPSRA
eukprot:GILK01006770.1.p1 GENE.GILK01006770.1~~GILK01006770.1.p1  ORF type:complete len:643 (+),score=105.48 GILK01006770.1:34-1962(+)